MNKTKLKQIIKEELQAVLNEDEGTIGGFSKAVLDKGWKDADKGAYHWLYYQAELEGRDGEAVTEEDVDSHREVTLFRALGKAGLKPDTPEWDAVKKYVESLK